jgi:uncharacterized iron-regulated protein
MTRRVPAPSPVLVVIAAAALLASCGGRRATSLVSAPIAPTREWVATEHREHPLVGRIWAVRQGQFVDEAALLSDVAQARFVVLGENHDNPDHHILQARLVRAVTAAGRHPALAFEMLTPEQQPEVDAAVARRKGADAIRDAVDWDRSGWPKFRLYRPVFTAGLEAGLPVLGANLPRKRVQEIVRKGADALPPPVRERIDRQGPLSPDALQSWRAEMAQSHCGEFPAELLEPMVLGQRARDAQMADAIERAAGDGAVLVTGSGHARTDRGVPTYLAPGAKVVAVAFREVDPGALEPKGYGEPDGALPFDYVVFTPAASRPDPCEELRENMRKHGGPKLPEHLPPAAAPREPTRPAPQTPPPGGPAGASS